MAHVAARPEERCVCALHAGHVRDICASLQFTTRMKRFCVVHSSPLCARDGWRQWFSKHAPWAVLLSFLCIHLLQVPEWSSTNALKTNLAHHSLRTSLYRGPLPRPRYAAPCPCRIVRCPGRSVVPQTGPRLPNSRRDGMGVQSAVFRQTEVFRQPLPTERFPTLHANRLSALHVDTMPRG